VINGEKIKLLMIKDKMSVKELVEALDISSGYTYKILNNQIKNPDPTIIHKLAEIFNCSIEEIVLEETTDRVYYDEPEILNNMPDDLKDFILKEESTPYITFAKQLTRYDIDEMLKNIKDTDMQFLLHALKMHIDKTKK
jgi:transcriptional regulator with XRE-family HTH domain